MFEMHLSVRGLLLMEKCGNSISAVSYIFCQKAQAFQLDRSMTTNNNKVKMIKGLMEISLIDCPG